jgi:perosamine synthetase
MEISMDATARVASNGSRPARRQFIPWAEPHYWGREEAYALEALRSSWISGGPFVDRLEAGVAAFCGSPHTVAASNGTTAIHMAFLALGVKPNDEIVVPGFAFLAAANIALHMNAVPVFADVDPDTWCVTADAIARVITPRTVGIVPVHSYGNMCDMQPILDLAADRGLWVCEDAAEALGSTYYGAHAGTTAEIGTYSFHATKTITTGEGGAVATRSSELRDRMQLFRSHGVKARRYFHEVPGHNFRLTNLQAAIGCAQLEQINSIRNERGRVYRSYVSTLGEFDGIRLQRITDGVEPLVWAIALHLDESAFPQGRDTVIAQLAECGIETRPGFHAASEMSALYAPSDIPTAGAVARQVISLPSSPTVTDDEIDFISSSLLALAK